MCLRGTQFTGAQSNVGGLQLHYTFTPYLPGPASDPDQVTHGWNEEEDSKLDVASYDENRGNPQWLADHCPVQWSSQEADLSVKQTDLCGQTHRLGNLVWQLRALELYMSSKR